MQRLPVDARSHIARPNGFGQCERSDLWPTSAAATSAAPTQAARQCERPAVATPGGLPPPTDSRTGAQVPGRWRAAAARPAPLEPLPT